MDALGLVMSCSVLLKTSGLPFTTPLNDSFIQTVLEASLCFERYSCRQVTEKSTQTWRGQWA